MGQGILKYSLANQPERVPRIAPNQEWKGSRLSRAFLHYSPSESVAAPTMQVKHLAMLSETITSIFGLTCCW